MHSDFKAAQTDCSSYKFCVQYASDGQGTVCGNKRIFFTHPIPPHCISLKNMLNTLYKKNKLTSFCVHLCAVNQEQLETKQSITKLSEEVNETNTLNQN